MDCELQPGKAANFRDFCSFAAIRENLGTSILGVAKVSNPRVFFMKFVFLKFSPSKVSPVPGA